MPPVQLQIKNNAVGLPDNGLACYGMSVAVYDTGAIHHRADCVVKAFDLPLGTGTNVSASVVLRSDVPVGANGLTGYTLSWGRNADNSNLISCYEWHGGVQNQIGVITASIPTPFVGDTFSGAISGSALTAFVNGAQKASFSDATITTGNYAGVHFFRSSTASNCYFDSFATFAISGPVITPPGNRPVQDWPFSTQSPVNWPIGDAIAAAGDATGSGGYYSGMTMPNYTNGFGRSVWNGNSPDQNLNQASDKAAMEGHYAIIGQAAGHVNDRTWVQDWYQHDHATAPTREQIAVDLKGLGYNTQNMVWSGNSGAWGHVNVAGFSNMWGLIRPYDMRVSAVALGYIPHALACTLTNAKLKAGFVWPASNQDGDAGSAYAGLTPIGSLLYIPWNTAKPAGLNTTGTIIFETLRRFGMYVFDRGPVSMYPEANMVNYTHVNGEKFSNVIVGQLSIISPLLVRASNSTQANPGGPGNRRAPLAPTV